MSKKKVTNKSTLKPTASKVASKTSETVSGSVRIGKDKKDTTDLLFGKQTYMVILAGIGVMVIGFFLMAGGSMPSPEVWDEDIIYSTRRTLIAPIFILAGLGVQLYAIFKTS